jgi:hypothetical protein
MRMRAATSFMACWLCLSLSATAGQPAPIDPDEGALRVITDTPEYCVKLLQQIDRIRDHREELPARVEMLTSEGQRMCARGYVRRGIVRLRRALVILQAAR